MLLGLELGLVLALGLGGSGLLLGGLAVFDLLEGGGTGISALLGLLRAALLELLNVETNNGTLDTGSAADTLLGNLLDGSLLVHSAVHNGPVELAGVLLLVEQAHALSVQEREHRAGALHRDARNIADSMSGPDLETGEQARVSLDRHLLKFETTRN